MTVPTCSCWSFALACFNQLGKSHHIWSRFILVPDNPNPGPVLMNCPSPIGNWWAGHFTQSVSPYPSALVGASHDMQYQAVPRWRNLSQVPRDKWREYLITGFVNRLLIDLTIAIIDKFLYLFTLLLTRSLWGVQLSCSKAWITSVCRAYFLSCLNQ